MELKFAKKPFLTVLLFFLIALGQVSYARAASYPECGVPVATTVEAINSGAFNSISDKTSLSPPCSVNGTAAYLSLSNVLTSEAHGGGVIGECSGSDCPWSGSGDPELTISSSGTTCNQPDRGSNCMNVEVSSSWRDAGQAPTVWTASVLGQRIDVEGFAFYDGGHGWWELHPVVSWRLSNSPPEPSGHNAPVLTVPGRQTITVGSSITFTVTASDPDPGDSVTLTASGLPSGATFGPDIGVFSWNPSSSQTGTYTIAFTATDNGTPPLSDSKTVDVAVNQGSSGPCFLCPIVPSGSMGVWLAGGGLLGLLVALAAVKIRRRPKQ